MVQNRFEVPVFSWQLGMRWGVGRGIQELLVRARKQVWGSPDKCLPMCHFNF